MVTAWSRNKNIAAKEVQEAVNLEVTETEHLQEVSTILGYEVQPNQRLSMEDTVALKDGGFDLSKLNPGSTAFWRRPIAENLARLDGAILGEYPTLDEKIVYQAPRYRSKFSTKMTAFVWRNGEKNRFKVKLGQEVHSEIIVCRLRQVRSAIPVVCKSITIPS